MRQRGLLVRGWLVAGVLAVAMLVCGGAAADSAAGAPAPKADIVFVLDESGSMSNEIEDVRRNIRAVAAAASKQIDARYGLVAFGGSPPDGPKGEPFTRTNYTSADGLAVALAHSGSFSAPGGHQEEGLFATSYAFTALTGVRNGAGACAVLVSDEPPSFRKDRATDLADAIASAQARRGVWYGIVNTGSAEVIDTYGSLARATGGMLFSISSFRKDPSAVLASVVGRCAARVEQKALGCTITGTAGADVLRGTPARDVICALAGNDVVFGGGGHDTIYGGAGRDTLRGGTGRDRVIGGAGGDYLLGGRGNDRLFGGLGRDRHLGGSGADTLLARDGRRDVVHGGPGRDVGRVDPRLDRIRSLQRLR